MDSNCMCECCTPSKKEKKEWEDVLKEIEVKEE
ncbi:MAG: hypothetical protein KatS3mg003_2375 [Candidatus Nitrosocaldaceae archaeon]|nr:MAG: hypothetical protein KatS3mg003_2375 [Candidatus Nitrosocaldaceae archaeon]